LGRTNLPLFGSGDDFQSSMARSKPRVTSTSPDDWPSLTVAPSETEASQISQQRALSLSRRQLDCLAAIAAGQTSAQIAAALGLSKRTVDEHVSGACRKLGVKRRSHAVAKSIRLGLLSSL
jgi:DNA-binding CsgD family transcriptional regulator